QHVFPDLPAGHVGICPGKYMASSDELYITITGKGGHGALPHLCIDPIVIAAELITALQQLVARTANPFLPSVLTLGKINSIGGATNIIPEQVAIEGTFRTMDEAWRYEAHRWIENTTKGIADAHGASARVEIKVGYPCLNNDEALTHKVKSAMVAFLGEDKVHDIPKRMTSEDFAYFAQLMPACFYRLGVAYADGRPAHGVHSPYFEVDEKALETAIGLMAWLAVLP
ncbi:MAG TPA: amidohydrolase, partial [Saprospiraceae bacterium]|nr:amidohydrolase [Saprospiraceae bacterium]